MNLQTVLCCTHAPNMVMKTETRINRRKRRRQGTSVQPRSGTAPRHSGSCLRGSPAQTKAQNEYALIWHLRVLSFRVDSTNATSETESYTKQKFMLFPNKNLDFAFNYTTISKRRKNNKNKLKQASETANVRGTI